MITDNDINRIYDELQRRIQHIGIALLGYKREQLKIDGHYDIQRTDTPSIAETEDAFLNWNCAILTAFRGSKELTPEANFKRNIKRNECLKTDMQGDGLRFRSVNGCYREAGMDKPDTELCFFVTNTEQKTDARTFFSKVYRHSEKYEQDSFLFTFPGVNRVAFLIATNDDGRKEFRGDIKFAGPLFTHVPDWNAWTDCSDGRISFRLKGMIMMGGTGNKRIKFGEGDIFDVEGYNPDGIIVIRKDEQDDLKESCKGYSGSATLVKRFFKKGDQTEGQIHDKVLGALKVLADKKCRRIGFHCTATIDGSSVAASKVVYETIKKWAERKDIKKRLEWIVLVDIYGDYGRMTNRL